MTPTLPTMRDTIEEGRMLSKLSDRYHIVGDGAQQYGCFAGIVLPIDLANTVVIWALVGAKYYSKSLDDRIEEVIDLNPDDPTICNNRSQIAWYLWKRMTDVMTTWSPEHFDDVVGVSA